MFPLSQQAKIKRQKKVAPNLSNPSKLINSKLNLKQEMISYKAKTKHTKFRFHLTVNLNNSHPKTQQRS